MQNYKNGNYKNLKEYIHDPISERHLFKDSLTEYLKNIDGEINGLEIGVLWGDTTKYILGLNERIKLTGIDPIIPDSMNAKLVGDVDRIIENTNEYKDRFKFIKDYSFNVVDEISDKLDFLFIDASHHYEDVKKDYELYFNKVKSGGLIYFHDSRMNRGGAPWHVGSSKFVDEQIINNKDIDLIGEAFSLTCFIKK